eukprot:2339655-Ditylum_brightwellii.AAC.1
MGGDAKNNVTKNRITKFKIGNPEEFINWRIQLNYIIQNKPCKTPESQFAMVEMLLGDEDEESSKEEEENNEGEKKKEQGQSSTIATSATGLT